MALGPSFCSTVRFPEPERLDIPDLPALFGGDSFLVGIPPRILSAKAAHPAGRHTPEFNELAKSLQKQVLERADTDHAFFPRTTFEQEHARAKYASHIPAFFLPAPTYESPPTVGHLQRRYLTYLRNNDLAGASKVEKALVELYALADGRLEEEGLGVIEGDEFLWALKYCSAFCADPGCHGPLGWSPTSNSYLTNLVWYEHECGHALRFCEACAPTSICFMCDPPNFASCVVQRRVCQAVADIPLHRECMVAPCATCQAL